MDRGAWQATVHGVAKSWTRLSDFHVTLHLVKMVEVASNGKWPGKDRDPTPGWVPEGPEPHCGCPKGKFHPQQESSLSPTLECFCLRASIIGVRPN